jgi:DNA-binding transcriptional MerR regulator
MKTYSIQQLVKIAQLSSRTLRYYDQIGLLSPTNRDSKGARIYDESDLLKLQQILIYKELALPLAEIKAIVGQEDFDIAQALENHNTNISLELERLKRLQTTIQKTILHLKGQHTMLTDEELYDGLSKEKIAEYNQEVDLKYDPKLVAESRQRVKNYTKQQWQEVKEEGGKIYSDLAEAMEKGLASESEVVQAIIARHYQHLNRFYTPNVELYAGLGEMYIQDARFTAFFEKIHTGLAKYISNAINYYCAVSAP